MTDEELKAHRFARQQATDAQRSAEAAPEGYRKVHDYLVCDRCDEADHELCRITQCSCDCEQAAKPRPRTAEAPLDITRLRQEAWEQGREFERRVREGADARRSRSDDRKCVDCGGVGWSWGAFPDALCTTCHVARLRRNDAKPACNCNFASQGHQSDCPASGLVPRPGPCPHGITGGSHCSVCAVQRGPEARPARCADVRGVHRCELRTGHVGRHEDGSVYWPLGAVDSLAAEARSERDWRTLYQSVTASLARISEIVGNTNGDPEITAGIVERLCRERAQIRGVEAGVVQNEPVRTVAGEHAPVPGQAAEIGGSRPTKGRENGGPGNPRDGGSSPPPSLDSASAAADNAGQTRELIYAAHSYLDNGDSASRERLIRALAAVRDRLRRTMASLRRVGRGVSKAPLGPAKLTPEIMRDMAEDETAWPDASPASVEGDRATYPSSWRAVGPWRADFKKAEADAALLRTFPACAYCRRTDGQLDADGACIDEDTCFQRMKALAATGHRTNEENR